MRAAWLLSALFIICGILAGLGYPAVHIGGKPVTGVNGLFLALIAAFFPPLVVLAVRKFRRWRDRQ